MTSTAAVLAHPLRRVLYGLLALALASSWLVAAAMPADAQTINWGVDSPGPHHIIHEGFTLVGFAEGVQDPTAVRARIRQPDGQHQFHNLRLDGEPEVRGGVRRSLWKTSIGVDSLPLNGTYLLEVQVVDGVRPDGSSWQGHEVIVDRAPVAELEHVKVVDADARTVEVRWARAPAPDFIRYVLQRAHGDGEFADVHTATVADAHTHVDTVPEHGEYRYRIKVVRRSADGGERQAVSSPSTVAVHPRPQPPAGGEAGQGGGNAGGAPPAARPRLSTRGGAVSGSGTRPGNRAGPPPGALESSDVFEGQLDYGVDLPQWDESLAEGSEGGTLTVFDREASAETALVPVAGGLVLTLLGLHIVRFLREDPDGVVG